MAIASKGGGGESGQSVPEPERGGGRFFLVVSRSEMFQKNPAPHTNFQKYVIIEVVSFFTSQNCP